MRAALLGSSFVLLACSAQVSDLDRLEVDGDACDPRAKAVLGTDLDLEFRSVVPHVDQEMFFAVTVGEQRNVEAMMVFATLDDPNLHIVVPKLLPAAPSELAFWADSMPLHHFDPINSDGRPIDHQWTRPICPDGKLVFTHTTPFQNIQGVIATGAVFKFDMTGFKDALFEKYTMWLRVTQLDDNDGRTEVQTRAFYRWSPPLAVGDEAPALSDGGLFSFNFKDKAFRVGDNALGERRGPIDKLSLYNIEFVIDVDGSGELSGGDMVCRFEKKRAPDEPTWSFVPDLSSCDIPNDFAPLESTQP